MKKKKLKKLLNKHNGNLNLLNRIVDQTLISVAEIEKRLEQLEEKANVIHTAHEFADSVKTQAQSSLFESMTKLREDYKYLNDVVDSLLTQEQRDALFKKKLDKLNNIKQNNDAYPLAD